MTACERATAGLEATVMVEEVEVSQATVASSFRPQAWRAAMRQFVQDVLLGLQLFTGLVLVVQVEAAEQGNAAQDDDRDDLDAEGKVGLRHRRFAQKPVTEF